jgi:hypothetical protein
MLYFILQSILGAASKTRLLTQRVFHRQAEFAVDPLKKAHPTHAKPQIARSFLVKQPFFSANRAFSALYFPASRL